VFELFYYPGNASMAPHFVLEELGVPFELRLVDRKRNGQKDPEYMKRNPLGRIPTLVDGELVLFESAAICLHLADRHPEANLAPALGSDDRAHLYKWLMFLTNTIQPDLMEFFYPDRHTTRAEGIPAVRAAAEQRSQSGFVVIDDALRGAGPYLLGERPSVADFFLLMLVQWAEDLSERPSRLAGIRRCADLIAARPAVQRAVATEGLGPLY
jgi:glutathione S-transferase